MHTHMHTHTHACTHTHTHTHTHTRTHEKTQQSRSHAKHSNREAMQLSISNNDNKKYNPALFGQAETDDQLLLSNRWPLSTCGGRKAPSGSLSLRIYRNPGSDSHAKHRDLVFPHLWHQGLALLAWGEFNFRS